MKAYVTLTLLLSIILVHAKDTSEEDAKVHQILTAVVRDVLFSDHHKESRNVYGTEGDQTIILLNGTGFLDQPPVSWPEEFTPQIAGFTFIRGRQEAAHESHNRRLAIQLFRLSYEMDSQSPFNIIIAIMNGGGSKNGSVMGGTTIWYSLSKKGDKWVVQYRGGVS